MESESSFLGDGQQWVEKNDGYQYVFLYDGTSESSTLLYEQEFEHVPGSQSSTVKTYSFYTIIVEINKKCRYSSFANREVSTYDILP